MIFSTQTIMTSMNNSLPVNEETILDIDSRSFFIEAVEMISEEQKMIRTITTESFSREVVYEGIVSSLLKAAIKRIDPKKILIRILQGFMDLLDKLWNNFHAFMLNFLGDNNVIKHYRKELETITTPVYFSNTRFIYTNLGNSTSYTTFKNELDKEYSNLILNLSKIHDSRTYESLFSEIERMRNEIDLSDKYFDEVRGNVVGSRESIQKENFAEALFKYFRNNGNPIGEGMIMPGEIKAACQEYFDYKKSMRQIQKDKSDLKDAAKKLQKDIMNINLEDYVKESIPQDAQNMFIKVLENKSKRVNDTCNVFLQVFSVKADAVKEAYSQYTKILMCAAKALVKEGN